MAKTRFYKPLSEYSKGILDAETKVSKSQDGVKTQAKNITLFIEPKADTIKLDYDLCFLNYKGQFLPTAPIKKTVTIRDVEEEGEVELTESTLTPIMETYVKTKDENLMATDWNEKVVYLKDEEGNYIATTVGKMIISSAVSYVERIENID